MSTIESDDHLNRIRQVREPSKESGDEPEVDIFVCPIDGCSQTVVDDPTALRSHVRQISDGAHRYKTLNGDLEIETTWNQMDWDPGLAPKGEF